jgi:hypothetical protein
MKRTALITLALLAALTAIVLASVVRQNNPAIAANIAELAGVKPHKTLRAFRSEDELKTFLAQAADRQKRQRHTAGNADTAANSSSAPAASPLAAEAQKAGKDDESVTNTQHAGVDEGGIVKLHGDHLVILRRGRLFTVRVGDNSLKAVDAVDAFAPGIDPSSDWYDEMLVSDDTVVVIGYSYGRGGTEINLFGIDASGGLEYRSTYHLRSNDYYSSRNYASRLIGNKLIFYTPSYLGYYGGDPLERFPAVRRWHKGATDGEFRRIVQPTRVYRAETDRVSNYGLALHTVTVCDLSSRDFKCEATATLGAPGRIFYVSPNSVYVWTTDWDYADGRRRSNSMLYRMPLDGSAPSAIGVMGAPVDQFSFLESSDQNLNVLVRSDGTGEQMWGSEFAAGEVALLRLPTDSFSDGSQPAPYYRYRDLPKPEGYTFQNRFVGDFLLYGTGSGWGQPPEKDSAELVAVKWATGEYYDLQLKHGVDRIEQMGRDAVVVGTNGRDLYFSPVRLGHAPDVRESYIRANASQGETRSHGFFYKADSRDSGLLGLPIAREGRPGHRQLVEGSAAIMFVRNQGLKFREAGELGALSTSANDGCRASCVDWYGNARPLFVGGRVFALLGYEIVEGSLLGDRIAETRRINYSPGHRRQASE